MSRTHPRGADRDAGFTLVEVVVAMLLVSLLAMAFLPLVLRSTTAAAAGTTLAAATRLASKQLETVRETALTACPAAGPEPFGTLAETFTDARGAELQAWTRYVGSCSAPGAVRYEVTVTRSSAPTVPLSTATTLVPVPAW